MFFENKRFRTRRRRPRRPRAVAEKAVDAPLEIAEKAVSLLAIKLDPFYYLDHDFRIEARRAGPFVLSAPLEAWYATELRLARASTYADVMRSYDVNLAKLKRTAGEDAAPFRFRLDAAILYRYETWHTTPFASDASLHKPVCWPREYCEEHIGICHGGPPDRPCPEEYCLCLPKY